MVATSHRLGLVFGGLDQDPEKWIPVFGKDHVPSIT
jgi:hypothetical protein